MKKKISSLIFLMGIISTVFTGCSGAKVEDSSTETSLMESSVVGDVSAETTPADTAPEETTPVETTPEETAPAEVAHEHTITYISNEDGTHNESCADCDYVVAVDCVLGEDYVCGVCGWSHEHDCVAVANEDETHTYSCKYNGCTYSYVEECEYSAYECVCGNAYPWEADIQYFGAGESNVYYAQKELNIYRYPNTDSEVVGSLSVDEEVICVGSVFYGSGANYERYLVTESGGCIPTVFHQSTNRWDLRIAKTNQVVVRCGNNYTIYDSYDTALQSVCGYSWSTVQQTFTYNDYKSQGQPFMNSYTSMGTGITVATKDGSIPYSCNINGTDYYFE